MSKARYALMILVAFLGGLVGGLVATRFLTAEVAFAKGEGISFKKDRIYAGKVIAEEFFLEEKRDRGDLDAELTFPRAVLTTDSGGGPRLIMQDRQGNPRISIGLDDVNGPTLSLNGPNGKPMALFAENHSQDESRSGPQLSLMDDKGEVRAQIGVRKDGNPFLCLVDPPSEDKKPVRSIVLSLEKTDKAKISLVGGETGQGAELFIDAANTRLALKDATGTARTELGSTDLAFGKDGSLEKASGDSFSVEKRPESSLVLYDEKGKVLWTAP